LAQKGGDWQRYDTQFRKLKAQFSMRWELPHLELWMDCLNNPSKPFPTKPIKSGYKSFRPQRREYNQTHSQSKFANYPKGVCFDFHAYAKCKRGEECTYSHKCFTTGCGGPHYIPSQLVQKRIKVMDKTNQIKTSHSYKITSNNHSTRMPTPIKYQVLDQLLEGYDPQLRTYLVNGFRDGFSIDNDVYTPNCGFRNLKNSFEHPEIIDKKLQNEIDEGRVSGPHDSIPLENMVFSPIGLKAKKQPGQFRVIHHLSYPHGNSINSGIARENATIHYATVPQATGKIIKIGKGSFLAKTDIKSAFRIVPVHPKDYHLLGMKWRDKYLYDMVLPFGLSSSCKIFEAFSTALEWIISKRLKDTEVLHIIDDFLFIAKTLDLCQFSLSSFINLCDEIGIPLAPEKTVGPVVALPFAGIDLNTIEMAAYLPQDKIEKCLNIIDNFLTKSCVTLKEMQSLTGMLNFACGIIVPGRAFSRRLYDLTIGVKKSYYKIKLTNQVKEDLLTWKLFLLNSNKKYFFLNYVWQTNEVLQLYTDASKSIGFGACFGSKWISGNWVDSVEDYCIALLEIYPIFLAIYIWGEQLSNKCLMLKCDNISVVHIINNNTSKNKNIMSILRRLVIICMKYNIYVKSEHIPGKLNFIADYLSRSQVPKARLLAPYLAEKGTQIPSRLQIHRLLKDSISYWDMY
jgi:hypothetical protein